jgi:hypothetical protein
MPESKINKLAKNLTNNLNCDWLIIWHFHLDRHYEIDWLDYFCTWDWLKHLAVVTEDLKWNLRLMKY